MTNYQLKLCVCVCVREIEGVLVRPRGRWKKSIQSFGGDAIRLG